MIDLSYFKFCICEKVGGLGGTPRNTSSYCFLNLFIMIFVFLLYFREVLND